MKTRIVASLTILSVLAILLVNCKLIGFAGETIFVEVTLDEEYHVQSNSSSYDGEQQINLAQTYADAGVTPQEIVGVELQLLEIIITENNTGDNTTANGSVYFRNSAAGSQEYLLAGFVNQNLNQVLNQPITPFSIANELQINPAGVQQLKTMLLSVPPPTLVFRMAGTANNPPVNFKARVNIDLQVEKTTG
ncbi:MAG TPA: hypothetical protein ENH29_09540 [Bacteroidetes bacterium]|nr:hypothetical protein [Bacteroidota bacterium]